MVVTMDNAEKFKPGPSLGVLLTAYMRKARSAPKRGWRRVFVVLTTDSISWFERNEGSAFFGQLRRTVLLTDISEVVEMPDPEGRKFEIKVASGKRRRFQAETAEARGTWVAALEQVRATPPPSAAEEGGGGGGGGGGEALPVGKGASTAAAAPPGGGGGGAEEGWGTLRRQYTLKDLNFLEKEEPPLEALALAVVGGCDPPEGKGEGGGGGGGGEERVAWLPRTRLPRLPPEEGEGPAAAAAAGPGAPLRRRRPPPPRAAAGAALLLGAGDTVRVVLAAGAGGAVPARELLEAAAGEGGGGGGKEGGGGGKEGGGGGVSVAVGGGVAVVLRAAVDDPAAARALLRPPAGEGARGGGGAKFAFVLGVLKSMVGLGKDTPPHGKYAISVLFIALAVRVLTLEVSAHMMGVCAVGLMLSIHNFLGTYNSEAAKARAQAATGGGGGCGGGGGGRVLVHVAVLGARAAGADAGADRRGAAVIPAKFMNGCFGDAVEARRRWDITYRWRRKEEIDALLLKPQPFYHVIKKGYPHFYCGYARSGNLVYYEQSGKVDLSEAEAAGATLDDLVAHYTFLAEFCWRVLDPSAAGKTVSVLDLAGISLAFCRGRAFEFVKRSAALLQEHYPECCQVMLVVNVPSWFALVWKLAKPLVNEVTLKKIRIVGAADTLSALQEFIDDDQIPAEYGGTAVFGDGAPDAFRFQNPLEAQIAAYVDAGLAECGGTAGARAGRRRRKAHPVAEAYGCPCHPPPPDRDPRTTNGRGGAPPPTAREFAQERERLVAAAAAAAAAAPAVPGKEEGGGRGGGEG